MSHLESAAITQGHCYDTAGHRWNYDHDQYDWSTDDNETWSWSASWNKLNGSYGPVTLHHPTGVQKPIQGVAIPPIIIVDDLVWQTPPPSTNHGRPTAFVETLKTRPGEWAIFPYQVAPNAPSKFRTRFPGTEWAMRNTRKPDQTLYGRWIHE